jgi:hypothetical protein
VDGIGPALVAFVVITALAQVFYCASYHIFFSTLGDADCRGSQVSALQALGALAGVFGPALGVRQTRLTVSLPTAPLNSVASARRTRRVLVPER